LVLSFILIPAPTKEKVKCPVAHPNHVIHKLAIVSTSLATQEEGLLGMAKRKQVGKLLDLQIL
jgi:hypothetical protein